MAQVSHMLDSVRHRVNVPIPRSHHTELLDENEQDPQALATNFRDIRRVNRLLGGTSVILRLLPRLLEKAPANETVTLLDLATGCADIPVAISRWASRRGMSLMITASDHSDDVLALARNEIVGCPGITLARYDARAVPIPDKHVDIVLCSLSLHHFPPHEAIQVIREMHRLARIGFIINDLRRSRMGYMAAWIAAHLTTRNRLTRNDAPLSVRRAYTPTELHQLLKRAGIEDAVISRRPWFRMAAIVGGIRADA